MGIKNVIQEQRISKAKYRFVVAGGVGEILFTSIGDLEEELDFVDLPDRTSRSGGRVKQIEFEVVQPMHHDLEVASMMAWWFQCQDPVSPTHLKLITYTRLDISDIPRRVITLRNASLMKKVEGESELDNDGEMSEITWTIKADQTL